MSNDNDPTEAARRAMLETGLPALDLTEADQIWDTDQLKAEFIVHRFLAPFISVTRKSDGAKGSLEFVHSPRWYFNFVKDEPR